MWNLKINGRFVKQYKNLDLQIQQLADKAISNITSSQNPSDLGVYKSNIGAFAYELGRKYRIIYSVTHMEKTVELLRICDHKSVYGKD